MYACILNNLLFSLTSYLLDDPLIFYVFVGFINKNICKNWNKGCVVD